MRTLRAFHSCRQIMANCIIEMFHCLRESEVDFRLPLLVPVMRVVCNHRTYKNGIVIARVPGLLLGLRIQRSRGAYRHVLHDQSDATDPQQRIKCIFTIVFSSQQVQDEKCKSKKD